MRLEHWPGRATKSAGRRSSLTRFTGMRFRSWKDIERPRPGRGFNIVGLEGEGMRYETDDHLLIQNTEKVNGEVQMKLQGTLKK